MLLPITPTPTLDEASRAHRSNARHGNHQTKIDIDDPVRSSIPSTNWMLICSQTARYSWANVSRKVQCRKKIISSNGTAADRDSSSDKYTNNWTSNSNGSKEKPSTALSNSTQERSPKNEHTRASSWPPIESEANGRYEWDSNQSIRF